MPRTRGTTTERGYGYDHAKKRAHEAPRVAAGLALCSERICLYPTRTIHPGMRWDLCHDRATGQYLGPGHRKCNRSEAARYINAKRGEQRHQKRILTSRPW